MVEAKCPYLSPHSQMQYAGEAAFSSLSTFHVSCLVGYVYVCMYEGLNEHVSTEASIPLSL